MPSMEWNVGRENIVADHKLTIHTGLDFIEKKTGHVFSRDQNEKITDGARNLYEKQTGYVKSFSPTLPSSVYQFLCGG